MITIFACLYYLLSFFFTSFSKNSEKPSIEGKKEIIEITDVIITDLNTKKSPELPDLDIDPEWILSLFNSF